MKSKVYIFCVIFIISSFQMVFSQKTLMHENISTIQKEIQNAYEIDLYLDNCKNLNSIDSLLTTIFKNEKQDLIKYWISYTKFYKTMYFLDKNKEDEAKTEVKKGIELLKNIETKNSEDLALLALLQCVSIPLESMGGMYILGDINRNIKKSIKLDPENIRAYYVAGSFDYYTPEAFGGGKEAERLLKKAISLSEQKLMNKYLPSWGKEESYTILIQLYKKRKQYDLAKKYYEEAHKMFPNNKVFKSFDSL